MDIIISISTSLTIGDIHFQSNKSMRYMKLIQVLIFDSAVILHVYLYIVAGMAVNHGVIETI